MISKEEYRFIKQRGLDESSKKRGRVLRRRYMMMLVYYKHHYELAETGKFFNRDHATVLHSRKKFFDERNQEEFRKSTKVLRAAFPYKFPDSHEEFEIVKKNFFKKRKKKVILTEVNTIKLEKMIEDNVYPTIEIAINSILETHLNNIK